MLRHALEQLVDEHDRAGSPLRSSLRPGLAGEEVSAAFAALRVEPNSSVVELYGWADGTDAGVWRSFSPSSDPSPVFGYGFTPLDSTVATAALLLDELGPHGLWKREWCPVFWSQTAGYVVDMADESVWFITADDIVRARMADNLEEFVLGLVADWRSGEYYFDVGHGVQPR